MFSILPWIFTRDSWAPSDSSATGTSATLSVFRGTHTRGTVSILSALRPMHRHKAPMISPQMIGTLMMRLIVAARLGLFEAAMNMPRVKPVRLWVTRTRAWMAPPKSPKACCWTGRP